MLIANVGGGEVVDVAAEQVRATPIPLFPSSPLSLQIHQQSYAAQYAHFTADAQKVQVLDLPRPRLTCTLQKQSAFPGGPDPNWLPSQTQKRKHQITFLAFQAKQKEQELEARKMQAKKSRQEVRAKYGW
jgi:hypothetical protein